MKKDKKVYKDRCKYETTQQTETYRQQTTMNQQNQKERSILAAKTKADIEKLDPFFNVNNNYLGMFKKDEGKQDNSQAVTFQHPLDQLGIVEYNFCQKCKRDRGYCPHQNIKANKTEKDQYQVPVTSSSDYGWREPIDNPNLGYGVKFQFQIFDQQFRTAEKKQEEKKS